jgi:glucan phosphoethanolaminetransferase (alkaline phosphatase superfamily)
MFFSVVWQKRMRRKSNKQEDCRNFVLALASDGYNRCVALCVLWIWLFFCVPDIYCDGYPKADVWLLARQAAQSLLLLWAVVYVLLLNRYAGSVLFPLLTLGAAVLLYFKFTIGSVFTPGVLDATITADAQTAGDLITPALIIYVAVCTAAALYLAVFVRKKVKYKFSWNTLIISGCLFVTAVVWMQASPPLEAERRIPFNLYFSTQTCFARMNRDANRAGLLCRLDCSATPDTLTVVLVLGETLRADHVGLNGYERNTTPLLASDSVISLPHVYSEYTHTNSSVPHIMTRATQRQPELARTEKSFIGMFRACGFYTAWLTTQGVSEGFKSFMHEADTLIDIKSELVLDTAMLPYFAQIISSNAPRKLIIFHTNGSHWIYSRRYSPEFAQFLPATGRRLSIAEPEKVVNAYDNTILFTDYFLHLIIADLWATNSILIYLSDHGESLGENGKFLHADDNLPNHYPAAFVWMSQQYRANAPHKYRWLLNNRDKDLRTDFLFPTILDAADLASPYLEKELSIFSGQ